jgi:hypothetical protein
VSICAARGTEGLGCPVKAVKAWLPAAGGSRYAHRERLNG